MSQLATPPSRRAKLIEAAQESWVSALTDLGGRNTLLYYKDRRSGTLDLTAADPAAVEHFITAGSIRLTKLFRDVDARADAIRRVQVIYRKAKELLEERGIRAGYLATGMARWDELFLLPAAPVQLRGLTIQPTRARHDDFELVLDEESEVNPVLLHKLASIYGAATDKLADQFRQAPAEQLYAGLRQAASAAEVPGFDIADRMVIGTFTYAKLPMVRDMQTASELLNDSDVVAAIAGDPEAQELLSGADDDDAEIGAEGAGGAGGSSPRWQAELDSPAADYSVLDADSSQRSAIAAVLSGHSLVIHGPPGTGKSQTIANLIAALVARGRKVLFVAEKRAAIDAVLSRLKGVDLGELVLDIHEGTRDRQRIARDLGASLDLAHQTQAPDDSSLRRRLADRQRRLTEHVKALHEAHPPWGLTPFQVQSALLGIPASARTPVRLPAPERITAEVADDLRDELKEFARLGGFAMRPGATPWFGAVLRTGEDVRQACNLAASLSSYTLPRLMEMQARASATVGLRAPASYADVLARMRLYDAVERTLACLNPAVFAGNPKALADAVAGTGDASMGERRRLKKEAQRLLAGSAKPTREEQVAMLRNAGAQQAEWESQRLVGVTGNDAGVLPTMPTQIFQLKEFLGECAGQLDALRAYVRLEAEGTIEQLAALTADQETAWRLPRLYELAAKFDQLALGPLLDELARNQAAPEQAAAAFDHAWYASILDQIRVRDPRYAAEPGGALDEVADDFRQRDIEYLTSNRRRVRHSWAQRLREAQDQHPLQARVIRKQAALRRSHLPLRRLLDQTSDVLFALKPCWAMSPLMVSQVLPATRLFDVVIFDEASQIVPADAIPAIMRGHQIVVAGDDRQLPPTNFFRQVGGAEDDSVDDDRAGAGAGAGGYDDDDRAEDEESLVSFGVGFESVLDALRPLLPTWPLAWHYRSRDERLVAFSNAHIYGGALTTFPGVFRDDCLRHVVVQQTPEPGQEVSVTAEVQRVVELIFEHARTRPNESLGVIALGIKHAERIDAALRAALTSHGDVEGFFAEDGAEPFFVKNLERVQGDERDAIILSIGYGKHPDGRMRYQWGPLLRDGGERRLNVAATRAKHRLTLVSSFSSHDVDPDRLTKAGAKMLADYLDYAGSGGTVSAASGGGEGSAELNPFEADVRDKLAECGITVVPQYGVGGYRVDFAATHPDDGDRMVLAIEADGASYHRSGSVRDRDRLRSEHLRRLGWSFHRIWSTSWFHDPASEVAKLKDAYTEAVGKADELTGPARPAAESVAGSAAGPADPDIARPGSAGLDPAGLDPAGPDPAEPDPAEPDPSGPDPARPDPAGPNPAKPAAPVEGAAPERAAVPAARVAPEVLRPAPSSTPSLEPGSAGHSAGGRRAISGPAGSAGSEVGEVGQELAPSEFRR
ncbi:MAG TPA: AAA domain-containing protein [Streptosporangiaceae bacterium]|nr:AAA domain-containing protein [Streptosporangiaceae bacterium]